MLDKVDALEAFRAEARAWLEDNFPASSPAAIPTSRRTP